MRAAGGPAQALAGPLAWKLTLSSFRKRMLVMVKFWTSVGLMSFDATPEVAVPPLLLLIWKTTSLKSRSPPPLRSSKPRIQRNGSVLGAPTITWGMRLVVERGTLTTSCGMVRP